jgi:hypothetical protein
MKQAKSKTKRKSVKKAAKAKGDARTKKKAPVAKAARDDNEPRYSAEEMLVTRKLIRPDLSDYKSKPRRVTQKKKSPPPENTNMETLFIVQNKEKQNRVTIKLTGGQTVSGWIEYYDKDLVKIRSEKPPHLLIRKSSIIYMHEDTSPGETKKKRK